jgi:hypothetical protein
MSKLTKIERFFNNVKLTVDDELFVGVDVHKKSYSNVGNYKKFNFSLDTVQYCRIRYRAEDE